MKACPASGSPNQTPQHDCLGLLLQVIMSGGPVTEERDIGGALPADYAHVTAKCGPGLVTDTKIKRVRIRS